MNVSRIEVERLRSGPVDLAVDEPPRTFELDREADLVFDENVTGELRFALSGKSVLITGKLKTRVAVECVRCLHQLHAPLFVDVSLTYMHDERMLQPKRYPELIGDETIYFDGILIDAREGLRELILLELPPFPACELEADNTCPVRGVKVGPMVFGETAQAPATAPEPKPQRAAKNAKKVAPSEPEPPANSWKAQLSQARKRLEGDGG